MAQRRSTNPSRPSPAHESGHPSNPDIFSDDFALEPFALTDGHQSAALDGDGSHDATSVIPQRSVSFSRNFQSPIGSLRRSRLSQRSDGESSVVSRIDDRASLSSYPQTMISESDSGNTASTQHRSVRTISTFGFPRAQSPYQGATGPSQPYGMYPQDIGLTRTPSAATASTVRQPERSYSGPSGPTQPYGMYAQNIVPEDDAGVVAGLAPPIAAGFSGSDQNFQRRLGPDREDVDDLIGPDGYTEQLPPYSRYANGVPPKYASGIGSVNRRNAPPPPPPPPPPVEDSQETLNSPGPREAALINPFGDSSTQLSSAASDVVPPKDECGTFKERVQRRSRTKVCCGISCWLCAVIVVVVFLAILLGGVIGGVVAHKRGEEKGMKEALAAQTVTAVEAAPTATVIQMSPPPDAISLSSLPSDLPPLPTGNYAVTLSNPTTATNSCLTNSDQISAWDCSTGAQLSMNVSMVGPHAPVVSLSYPQPSNAPIRYGAQPPELSGETSLMLYKDRDAFEKGAAYFFWQQYNKTVIVHNSDLPGGLPGSKRSFLRRWFSNEEGLKDPINLSERDIYDIDSQWPSNSIAQPADKPWYCYWPQTILEGFIFVYENSSGTATSASAAVTSAVSSSGPRDKRQAPSNLQSYPKVVKIEERRNPHSSIQPYCQQMQILNNNQPGPLSDPATQELIQIQLIESEPMVQHQMNQNQDAPSGPPTNAALPTGAPGRRRATNKRARAGYGPLCQCEWMSI